MSGEQDDKKPNGVNSKTDAALSPDDPRVTPLGGNKGVHIQREDKADEEDFKIDFGGFIVSLGTSCMVNLGKHASPETGRVETDLESALQVIDILKMLQQKTQGNLSIEEQQLLKTLLHDLQTAHDEAS